MFYCLLSYFLLQEDRHLRGAFFDAIVGVAAYVGWQCCPILKPLLQQVIIFYLIFMYNFCYLYISIFLLNKCMYFTSQGLTDSEEFVISKALCALSDLTKQGLIQKQMLYDIIAEAIPLLIHPVSFFSFTFFYLCVLLLLLSIIM